MLEPGHFLLKELGVGLQAAGAALHLLFGHAQFQPTYILRNGGQGGESEHKYGRKNPHGLISFR
jgi:hypothetical protein